MSVLLLLAAQMCTAWLTVFTTFRLDAALLTTPSVRQRNFQTWLRYTETQTEWQWLALVSGNCSLLPARIRCDELRPAQHSLEFRLPYFSEVLKRARFLVRTRYLMFANVDNIIVGNVSGAVDSAMRASGARHLFLSSRAIGVHVQRYYDWSISSERDEFYGLERDDFWWPGWACEAFLINRGNPLVDRMPPFLIGRVRWDNWVMQFAGMHEQTASVDTTDVIRVFHLNHGANGTYDKSSHDAPGTEYNIWLAVSSGNIEYGNHACMRYRMNGDAVMTANSLETCKTYSREKGARYAEIKAHVNS